jgi:hypothetical protein
MLYSPKNLKEVLVLQPMLLSEFMRRASIATGSWLWRWEEEVTHIVSLRQIARVTELSVMPMGYLECLLRHVVLTGHPDIQPYKDARVCTGRLDPRRILVPQTFIQRDKYQSFIESFDRVFEGFAVTRGVAKCTALIVRGVTQDGTDAIAHYLPPIVEAGKETVLLDGMHRNFLVMKIGTTMEAIFLENVGAPFPCSPQSWDKVSVVAMKPPREQRFFDLQPHLFRDLTYVGIDG